MEKLSWIVGMLSMCLVSAVHYEILVLWHKNLRCSVMLCLVSCVTSCVIFPFPEISLYFSRSLGLLSIFPGKCCLNSLLHFEGYSCMLSVSCDHWSGDSYLKGASRFMNIFCANGASRRLLNHKFKMNREWFLSKLGPRNRSLVVHHQVLIED